MQELYEQVVRQRDMLKRLLEDATRGAQTSEQAPGARLLLGPGTTVADSNGNLQVRAQMMCLPLFSQLCICNGAQ